MNSADVFPGSTKLVKGAVPPSSLLLIGPSGVGKTIFCKQFLHIGLAKGETCVYVSTNEHPITIESSMKSFGFDTEPFKEKGSFRIVDCYSWKTGTASPCEYSVVNPDLATVSMAIEKAIRGANKVRLAFDSITGLTSVCSYNTVYFSKFLQVTAAKIKALDGNAIFVAAPEAHDQQFISNLREVFDGTLEMKEDESGKEIKRLLRIFSLKGAGHKTQWTPFEITEKGIIVKSEVEFRCVMCSRVIEDEPIFEVVNGNKYSFDSAECVSTYRKLKALYGESFE
jgi:KaiC/GvpD/RAD55 family RecA-like ATPase